MEKQKNEDELTFTSRSQKKRGRADKANQRATWYYLGFVGDIGFTIALPIVLGAIIGKAIDSWASTGSTATLVGLGLGILLSLFSFVRKIQDIIRLS